MNDNDRVSQKTIDLTFFELLHKLSNRMKI